MSARHFYTPSIPADGTPMIATITPLTLDAFLASVEQRAYRMALLATRKSADALDIVQDAMLQLVQSYRTRPNNEWPLLFQRILQNRILDWHRQQTRQRRWFWQPQAALHEDDIEEDPIAQAQDPREGNPLELTQRAGEIEAVIAALEQLPLRQQQAFMLRAWEGMDVAETAAAMQCSEGSVKTHYFRALQTLRAALAQQ
ncbi:MAG: polymerase sigma factor [Verrucomicrobiaceae bacterium]|nr:polymerase sigma factor [Verrucomicrobiaceae bacterium]